MHRSALLRITLTASLLAGLGAFGCAVTQSEETEAAPDKVIGAGDTSALLKSTLVLEGGCTAAKVGPRHLLVSARCVTGNLAFAPGKKITFSSASTAQAAAAPDAGGSDAGPAPAADSGPGSTDAGAADAGRATGTSRDVTISAITIHPSYVAKCKADLCGFNKLESGDAPDIAVIVLADDLTTVPSIPVDLDPVGEADSLLAVTGGCSTLDGKAAAPKLVKTLAVPAKSVNHAGSAYETSPQLVSRLASSYVVTPGAGWHNTDPRLCKTDLGSPLFRGGSAAVAGVTANYTTYTDGKQPITTHHTRVDATSRFKIGDWLTTLGVETIHSCSETAGGCVKHTYDGGAPTGPVKGDTTAPGDAGTAPLDPDAGVTDDDGGATEPEAPSAPHGDQLPTEDTSAGDYAGEGEDYSDAAAPTKKKKAAASGCSTAPGAPAPAGELFLGLGLVLGAAVIRRRRAR